MIYFVCCRQISAEKNKEQPKSILVRIHLHRDKDSDLPPVSSNTLHNNKKIGEGEKERGRKPHEKHINIAPHHIALENTHHHSP